MQILIVDDDDIQRILLRRIIEKFFTCKVIEAKNGAEGLRKIGHEKPAAIFLDIWMPVMNGPEFLDAIQHTYPNSSIPVVVLSEIRDKEIIARIISYGISDYLLKPFTNEQVYDRMIKLMKLAPAKVPLFS